MEVKHKAFITLTDNRYIPNLSHPSFVATMDADYLSNFVGSPAAITFYVSFNHNHNLQPHMCDFNDNIKLVNVTEVAMDHFAARTLPTPLSSPQNGS